MYELEQFPGVIYRMENPNAVILIFSSGKLVCTGASSWKETSTEKGHKAVNINQANAGIEGDEEDDGWIVQVS